VANAKNNAKNNMQLITPMLKIIVIIIFFSGRRQAPPQTPLPVVLDDTTATNPYSYCNFNFYYFG